nr:BspA family leucine-rich repeat surface protein [uncultured Allomuricauda sp.]
MKKTLTSILLGLIHFFVFAQTEFITTWKTDNPGVSADNQITVPTFIGETYNYTIDWGDGTSDINVTGGITHTYTTAGTYEVSISGDFPMIYFNESGDADKLLNIKQWGNIAWTSMESAFAGCSNLAVGAADAPNLSNVTSLRRMFYYCNYLTYDYRNTREFSSFNGVENFDSWDVSTVTNMSNMFDKSSFDQDISSWDVSNVEDMSYMFFSSRFNKDINSWDVSNVTNMAALFSSGMFNQDISDWDVSNVVNIDFIFNSTYFNHDITGWNVANLVSMRHAFSQGHFDQDLSSWDISNVLDMSNAFDDSDLSKENYDAILIGWSQLSGLKTGVVLGANDAVYCTAENERATLINDYGWTINDYGIDCKNEVPFVTTWKTDNPGPSNDNQITIPTSATDIYDYRIDWGDGTFDEGVTGDITHTYAQPGVYEVSITGKFPRIYFNGYEFGAQTSDDLKLLSVDQWGSNRWKSMGFAFAGCENMDITATDIPDFSRGVLLTGMFWDAKSMEGNASIANWDIEKATYMNFMFRGASSFNGSIGEWDVTGKREFYGMFEDAESFDQDLSNWNVQNMENMTNLFKGSGLSNTNYDKILIGWSQLPSLKNGVQLGAPDNYYCSAAEERQYLIDTYGWVIDDAGANEACFFVTTWKTDNPGISADNQITIPTHPDETYNYTVAWGDGTSDENITGDITHTYATAGTYQVSISGDFPRIYFDDLTFNETTNDSDKIIDLNQWGSIEWTSMESAFHGCANLDVTALDLPDFSRVTSLVSMFRGCRSLIGNESMNSWDVSNITNLVAAFNTTDLFNQDISNWDVSNVTSLNGTFAEAKAFNQNLNDWDVSSVTNLGVVFGYASSFNQPLNNWDVSNVIDFHAAFAGTPFNQPLNNWDTSSASTMGGMFSDAVNFNQDISNWDTSSVIEMSGMFDGAASFDQNLGEWEISNVTNMDYLFLNAGISVENYDKTLIGWTNLPTIQNNVVLNAGSSQFCESEEARQSLIDNFGWTIIDAGKVPLCNEDNDADGVLDHLDLCLDTRPDAVVDDYGCEIIPADAVQVYVLTPSCIDSADGAVNLSMNVPGHLMNISISGDAYSDEFDDVPSGQEFEIGSLSAGMYTITVTIPEILFEQTYGVTVNSLSSVTGKRTSTDSENGTVVYEVVGSKNYDVLVNGEERSYSFGNIGVQTIVLNNLYGQSEVSISGENACQGIVSDSFFIGDAIQVYPTITSSRVNIMTNKSVINTMVFGLDGRLVRAINYDQNNKSIDVSTLKSGVYFLQMEVEGHVETVKIVKR